MRDRRSRSSRTRSTSNSRRFTAVSALRALRSAFASSSFENRSFRAWNMVALRVAWCDPTPGEEVAASGLLRRPPDGSYRLKPALLPPRAEAAGAGRCAPRTARETGSCLTSRPWARMVRLIEPEAGAAGQHDLRHAAPSLVGHRSIERDALLAKLLHGGLDV